MIQTRSLTTRIAIGKMIGLLFGLIGLIALPEVYPDASWMLRWGVLFWYTTLGAIVGVFGVFTYHPILMLPMPWWVRAPVIGGWMNFVLVFFAYAEMEAAMKAMFGPDGFMQSPFWFVAEGAVIGAIMGFTATKIAGEGRDIVDT